MNQTNRKPRIKNGILNDVANQLTISYSVAKARWYRDEPEVSNLVLKELKKINEVRLENYEMLKELNRAIGA